MLSQKYSGFICWDWVTSVPLDSTLYLPGFSPRDRIGKTRGWPHTIEKGIKKLKNICILIGQPRDRNP